MVQESKDDNGDERVVDVEPTDDAMRHRSAAITPPFYDARPIV
jgi:hypothetical protein